MRVLSESDLRLYQGDDVEAIREAYRTGYKYVLYVLPTGGGKTFVFTYITQQTIAKGKRVLILVHRDSLMKQSSESMMEFGVPHGRIKAGFTASYAHNVQIASVQTLKNRLDKIPAPDLIVFDEAHHANAKGWRVIIDFFPNARGLGVTATPIRLDGTGLGVVAGGVFDTMVLGPSCKWLTEEGYLVKTLIYGPERHLDFSDVTIKGNEYDSSELDRLLNKSHVTGEVISQYNKLSPGKPTVVFCASRSHAQNVAADFRNAGYRSVAVDSTQDINFIRASLEGLGNGSMDVVTSCDLISEGTDIPVIVTAIMLRKTDSLGLFLQMWGRILRPVYAKGYDLKTKEGRLAAIANSDKPYAILLDHVGNVGTKTEEGFLLNHGFATDERNWTLEGKKKGKRRVMESLIKCKQCSECFHMHEPAPKCPMCNFVYPKKEIVVGYSEGELKQIKEDEKILVSKKRKQDQAKAGTLEELKQVALQYGYKPAWAEHIFNSRQVKKGAVQSNNSIDIL